MGDKHEDIMGKFGAIIAQGILDAGGRNASIRIADARTGHVHMPSVVGMACFLSTWYWFPMAHFLSLALRPASLILLNQDLNLPKIQIKCAAKPSTFAYPPKIETKKEKKKEKVETAVLSVTAKKGKGGGKEAEAKNDEMDTKETTTPVETEEEKEKREAKKKKKKEPNHCMLDNPHRALPGQLKLLSIPNDAIHDPIKSIQSGGIVLVGKKSTHKDSVEELVERIDAMGPKPTDDGKETEEAPVPKAFKWLEEYDKEEEEEEEEKTEEKKDEKDDDKMEDDKPKEDATVEEKKD